MINENSPKFGAYAIEEGKSEVPGQETKDHWHKIGVGWEHKDEKGLTLKLNALPLNNKMVVRLFDEDRQKNPGNEEI